MSEWKRVPGNPDQFGGRNIELLHVEIGDRGMILVGWNPILHESPMSDETRKLIATMLRDEIERFEKGEYNFPQQPGPVH